MKLTIKTTDGRSLGSIATPCDSRTDWIYETILREFECREDEISFDEDENLGDVILVKGEIVARTVSKAGWRAM
jgi:hypothetical protein